MNIVHEYANTNYILHTIPHYIPPHAITGSLGAVQVTATPFIMWFGLNDVIQEGSWQWSSTRSDTTYYEWDTNAKQPDNNPGADYGCVIVPAMKWHDCKGIEPIPFICEYGL